MRYSYSTQSDSASTAERLTALKATRLVSLVLIVVSRKRPMFLSLRFAHARMDVVGQKTGAPIIASDHPFSPPFAPRRHPGRDGPAAQAAHPARPARALEPHFHHGKVVAQGIRAATFPDMLQDLVAQHLTVSR